MHWAASSYADETNGSETAMEASMLDSHRNLRHGFTKAKFLTGYLSTYVNKTKKNPGNFVDGGSSIFPDKKWVGPCIFAFPGLRIDIKNLKQL